LVLHDAERLIYAAMPTLTAFAVTLRPLKLNRRTANTCIAYRRFDTADEGFTNGSAW
jgi:hypothetical protein